MSGWCTIESDPAVLTEMLERFGVKNVAAEEIISLDAGTMSTLTKPVYGLMMLFKWKPVKEERNVIPDADLWFAKQTVNNACATQALLNILMNKDGQVDLGSDLKAFRDYSLALDATLRGDAIGQSELLRTVHNSFAPPTVFSFEERVAKEDDDVFHFIGYTFHNGAVWEMDGLQPGPALVEPCEEADWVTTAASAVEARIQDIMKADTTGKGQGISFNLMALCGDRVAQLEADVAAAGGAAAAPVQAGELEALQQMREKGKEENARRKHNYVPLLVNLFKAMAEKGQLRGVVEAAKSSEQDKKKARTE